MSFDPRTYREQKPALLDEVQLCPDVNGPELMRLAQFIEDCLRTFDMAIGFPDCETAGCILGHARLLHKLSCITEVQRVLGLTLAQRNLLFLPQLCSWPDYRDITKSMAVAAVRHLAYTGEVRFDP